MATTLKTDVIIPDIFSAAVQGVLAQKTCFLESPMASLGIVSIDGSMPGGPAQLNGNLNVPYFGTIGEFQANNTDGTVITPTKIAMVQETATIGRDSLAFEATVWSQQAGASVPGGDPYKEGARQIGVSAKRAMDKAIIDAALATGVYSAAYYSLTSPKFISYDMMVDARVNYWGDEQEDVAALAVHSRTEADLLKLKDAAGHPLLTTPMDGSVKRFMGLPLIVSDRLPVTGSVMGAVTSTYSTGTPPVITITGTPLCPIDLKIICTVVGTLGVWKFKFSVDGGNTYSAEMTSAASVPLTDTAVDSLVGVNGATGITIGIAAGTAALDHVWTAKASLKARSLLLKKNALAFWYNSQLLQLLTDKDILKHSDVAAMHLYRIAHRYRRLPGSTKGGVVAVDHNVSGFTGV